MARDLLPGAAVQGGRVRVLDVSRRNRNHRIETPEHGTLLTKQAVSASTRRSLTTEARTLGALRRGADASRVTRHLSRLLHADPGRGLLVYAAEPDAETVLARHQRTRRLGEREGRAVGMALGAVHRTRGGTAGGVSPVPGALSLHRPSLALARDMSPACVAMVSILQSDAPSVDALDRLATSWHLDALLHGDLRWDNVLLAATGGPRCRAVLVDWELSGRGDCRWDVACFLASALARWVESMPAAAGLSTPESSHLAGAPLEDMRPGLAAFVRAWEQTTSVGRQARVATRAAVVQLVAARLLQLVFEGLASETRLTATAVLEIQLAVNLLACPEVAAISVFGMDALP